MNNKKTVYLYFNSITIGTISSLSACNTGENIVYKTHVKTKRNAVVGRSVSNHLVLANLTNILSDKDIYDSEYVKEGSEKFIQNLHPFHSLASSVFKNQSNL
ncbi:MAG: hypothetical protein ACRCWQ_13635 [Bacilli bacterium]